MLVADVPVAATVPGVEVVAVAAVPDAVEDAPVVAAAVAPVVQVLVSGRGLHSHTIGRVAVDDELQCSHQHWQN